MPMICGMPWPTMVIMVNSSSRPGNDIQASTRRCTAKSSLPPTNPATPADQQRHDHAQSGAGEPHPERQPAPRTAGG